MDKRLGFELRTVPSLIIRGVPRLRCCQADLHLFLLFIINKCAANQDQQDVAGFSFLSLTWMLRLACWSVHLFLMQQICNNVN
jgi:hypothetical protein